LNKAIRSDYLAMAMNCWPCLGFNKLLGHSSLQKLTIGVYCIILAIITFKLQLVQIDQYLGETYRFLHCWRLQKVNQNIFVVLTAFS